MAKQLIRICIIGNWTAEEEVVFYQDIARPYRSIVTHQKLRELGKKVLIYAPYSPFLGWIDLKIDCLIFANIDKDLYERLIG